MSNKRNYGLDIYRILCCIGVLTYHVMDDVLGKTGGGSGALYFAASFCVPGFFLLSGYLLGMRGSLCIEYCESKVTDIMKKLFFWIVFWVAIHFMRTGEMYDLWSNVTAGAMSAGILPVAWYLFTYCLIMLLGYPLWHLMKKYPYLFVSLSLMWGILLAFDFGREFLSSKPQSLWLHLYIGYFCIGMSLHIVLGRLRELLKLKGSIILSIALCVVATIIYAFKVKTEKVPLFPHNYYGRWFYSIWLISLFWICSLVIINGKWQAKLLKKCKR